MKKKLVNSNRGRTLLNKKLLLGQKETSYQNDAFLMNGFTLVELIGVIILLGVIALIAYPTVTNSIKKSREQAYNAQIEQIVNAANRYGTEHSEILPETDGLFYKTVALSELIARGYIQQVDNGKVYNPIDKSEMKGCVIIEYKKEYSQYTYTYDEACSPQKVLEYDNYYVNYGGVYNETFREGIATSDGGFLAMGTFSSPTINSLQNYNKESVANDVLIVKYNSKGQIVWEKKFGGTMFDEMLSVVEIEENGKNYYIAVGQSNSTDYDINNQLAGYKPFIVKLDTDGNIITKKIYSEIGYIRKIIQIDGGYIGVGTLDADSNKQGEIYQKKINDYKGYGDAFIAKLNDNFEVQWSSFFGGTNAEVFIDVIAADNEYVAVGQGRSSNGDMADIYKDTDVWQWDAIIVSYDKNGNMMHKNAFCSSGHDSYAAVIKTTDGYIAGGLVTDADIDLASDGKSGAIIVKYDNNLNTISHKVIENNSSNTISDLVFNNDRIIAVGSFMDSNGYASGEIISLDTNLSIIKSTKFNGGNSDGFNAISKTSNGYAVFGSTFSKGKSVYDVVDPYSKGNQDAIMVRYDSDLELEKAFIKKVDLLLLPKEIVKNYGTMIPGYENINDLKLYTTNNAGEDIKNWCSTTENEYGNHDNYKYTYCLKPMNGSDIIPLYYNTNANGVSYIKGQNDYKMNKNLDLVNLENTWFRLFLYYLPASGPISEIKLMFNGAKYTIEECVNLGYIEPLVIQGYNANSTIYLSSDTSTILKGNMPSISTNGNTRIYVYFKTKKNGFEGVSMNVGGTPDNYRSFTLNAYRNFDISLSKAE